MSNTNGIELAPVEPRCTTPVQVLFNAGKVIEGFNIKKEVTSDVLSCLAPLIPMAAGKVATFFLIAGFFHSAGRNAIFIGTGCETPRGNFQS